MARVEQAIADAAASGDWIVQRDAPGRVVATYNPRTHMAKVAIDHTRDGVSISYLDSTTLNHARGHDRHLTLPPSPRQEISGSRQHS
jgi:hypothetical protein